ncbi:glycosyl hydrolase family 76 protein [Hirsutella rhossiliensis]|uniref:Mannan endo-1,6-alpha-mannosidase n=1 Tax=Hirsutella rhossiliensis TaxID=111463 RepID=A0A9P8N246_9HYPO|nr:glycosyl hydrolase family 76 protein [Hirsutella rhossiliensis]KAH0965537.1 glycosyl hydrolase family 76 protein [Hirsutella rhossiliensis]
MEAASTLAADSMSFYDGDVPGKTPGLLYKKPDPELWWWAGGVLFGTIIEYSHYTKDTKYNAATKAAMVHQAGANQDFLTPNWTAHMGNDDQGFWGLSAMSAAETNFDNPEPNEPQWLATAQGVFNTMAAPERHDQVCGGGLRWQLNLYSKGYNYKNSISNGLFFNLGARLARYTGNKTYEERANQVWDWERKVGLITDTYAVYDGASDADNCANIDTSEYTYNSGVFLHGAAFLYNFTDGSPIWRERVEGLLDHMLAKFFPNKIAVEVVCQNDETNLCERDSLIFKGVVHRWLANVAQIAPFTAEKILPVLKESAKAAVSQCTGGDNGRMCGFQWSSGKYDGKTNVGTEMSVLSAVVSVLGLRTHAPGPITEQTGGTSQGDSTAGAGAGGGNTPVLSPITVGSKVAASFLTLVVLLGIVGIQVWMILE